MLRLWQAKCSYCHRSAMSWLHIIVITAFGVSAVFYLLRIL